jgi:surfactin synthase thioesterase subunit
MKKLILLIVLCLGAKSFAQTNGITYQAVILNPNGEQLPGVNNTNAPMVDKNICMQFQFIDAISKLEYQETIQTKTDSFGMVNLVIGSGKQTAGYAASFQTIDWTSFKKSLIVSINTDGSCSSFTEISDQPFTAVPFAFSAINSGNVTGVVDIQNGGTNAVTIIGAKTNLGLEKLDNTSDVNKPVSTAAQTVLNLKENIANKSTTVTLGTSDTLFPTQNAVKIYVDSNIATVNASTATLQATVNENATAATKLISSVQADVDQNESDSDAADTTLQTNIDNLIVNTSNNTSSLQSELDATQSGAGLNTDGTYSANATTTYIATSASLVNATENLDVALAAAQADVNQNESDSDAAETTLQININTLSSTVSTNFKSTAITIAAVQADVDANETASNTSDAALQTNIDALSSTVTSNNTASNTAIAVVQADVDANETASNIADAALQTNIDALSSTVTSNNTASNAAIAVVQVDVDANETASNIADAALQTNIDALSSTVVSNNTASNTAIAVVQADVDTNETASNTSDAALQTNIDALSSTVVSNNTAATNAIALKEDAANKSTDVTLSDATDTKFPTELAVKTYIDNQVTNGIATNVSGIVAIVNGGTGSATQNFVDLTNNQNIAGNKTFGSDIIVNGLKIGNGGGSQSTVIGDSANASQANNTALGFMTLDGNSGTDNTVVGTNSMRNSGATSRNTSIGENSGAAVNTGNENTYLGYNANVTNNSSISNATAIGAGALVTSSNTIQLGNENVTNVNTKGSITANAEISSEITTNLTINKANAEQYKAKVIICNPSSQITITFANDLAVGFNCMVLQKSLDANKINLAAGAGVTLKNRNNFTATAGNYAIATIVNIGGGIIVTAGDMQ